MEETKEIKIAQKTDLLKFQQTLNDQFLEILSQKTEGSAGEVNNSESLGLSSSFRNVNMFISLKDLKAISTKLRYENSVRTKSWILGFNQDHGNIYTIFNLSKVLSLLIDNKTDYEIANLNINSNILYIKPYDDEHFGLLLNEFKLDYTAEFTQLFSLEKNDDEENSFSWKMEEGVDFHLFMKKENMSESEWELVNIINQSTKSNEKIIIGKFPDYNSKEKHLLWAFMFKKIYLDSYGKRPIFMLNLENLTKYLRNVSPF